uniref:3-methyl-2-oxobutanoate hydroxymethyltransferase n=1 Tax=Anthurium amnicola TaxID=1678845 RepID=A0A1D1ZFH9_9ARAE
MGAGGGEGAAYWLQWQIPVCALIFVLPAAVAAVVAYRLRGDRLGAADLWVPCWRGVQPGWLLGYRAAVLAVMSYVLYRTVLGHGAFAFYFYTQWTFALVIVYFALGTLISAHGCWIFSKQTAMISEERNRFLKRDLDLDGNRSAAANSIPNNTSGTIRLQSHQDFEDNEQRAGFWGYAMQVIYQTSAGAVILTDVVFWGLIVPFLSNEHFTLNLLMGCMHSLNLVFLLLDTALNRLPFPWFRMAYFVLWSCLYVIFQWILHACGFSWWPYPFLELATPWAPLWYFCMALVHIPCYAFYTLIVKAKNTLFSKWFPDTYIRSY